MERESDRERERKGGGGVHILGPKYIGFAAQMRKICV